MSPLDHLGGGAGPAEQVPALLLRDLLAVGLIRRGHAFVGPDGRRTRGDDSEPRTPPDAATAVPGYGGGGFSLSQRIAMWTRVRPLG